MIDFSNEINLIKKQFDPNALNLELVVSTEWRSSITNHRALIRHDFLERHAAEVSDRLSFLDLDEVPVLDRHGFSISHSETCGGYAFSNNKIGFDLIERHRLNEKILARVSSAVEIVNATDPAYLWPAKEAVYKACSGPISLITQVTVDTWKKLGENVFSFSVSLQGDHPSAATGRGFVFEKSNVLYGLFIGTP